MSLEQYIDVLSNVSPYATFEKLNAHFHQLEHDYPNFTLNFFYLCENAQLDTTQLLKISYIVSLIQTKLHTAQSDSNAHCFFNSLNNFSNLLADGYRSYESRPVSPCTVAVASVDLLPPPPPPTLALHERNNDKFNALCLVARRSKP
ncbi:MAG: hypothetical protein VX737_04200 [Pseudomonadota bacterium]|nr:hypothetical protein [Pseudomonadota bacterium]